MKYLSRAVAFAAFASLIDADSDYAVPRPYGPRREPDPKAAARAAANKRARNSRKKNRGKR